MVSKSGVPHKFQGPVKFPKFRFPLEKILKRGFPIPKAPQILGPAFKIPKGWFPRKKPGSRNYPQKGLIWGGQNRPPIRNPLNWPPPQKGNRFCWKGLPRVCLGPFLKDPTAREGPLGKKGEMAPWKNRKLVINLKPPLPRGL